MSALLLAGVLVASSTVPPTTPISVDVKLHLVELSAVNDRDQEFQVELYLYQSWKDPSLAGKGERTIPRGDIWIPNVEFVQARDLKRETDDTVDVQEDGTVLYSQHIWVTLSTVLDLRRFPFDQHVLPIRLESFSHAVDELNFEDDPQAISSEDFRVVEGWRLLKIQSLTTEHLYPAEKLKYSRFIAKIEVARTSGFYLWKIVLPLVLIIAMSWSVFWMDPKEFEAQMGVSVTSMLAVVAFNFTLADTLPRISYVTRMDVFIVLGYVFVFAAFLENLVTHQYCRRDQYERADRLDIWCRAIFPGLFLIQLLAFILWP